MAEKQKILIVDDDENIAELISLYLTKECYETKIVGDGEEALAVFPVFKPNLVLLDLMLPSLPGAQDFLPGSDYHALRQGRDFRQGAGAGAGS